MKIICKTVKFIIPDFIMLVTSLAALIELINSSCFLFQSDLGCISNVDNFINLFSPYLLRIIARPLTVCCCLLGGLEAIFFFTSSGI